MEFLQKLSVRTFKTVTGAQTLHFASPTSLPVSLQEVISPPAGQVCLLQSACDVLTNASSVILHTHFVTYYCYNKYKCNVAKCDVYVTHTQQNEYILSATKMDAEINCETHTYLTSLVKFL